MGAVFCKQLQPLLDVYYGDEQYGFRKGRSTISLLHILEAIMHTATSRQQEIIIVQIDVAKAFDKIHREALADFAEKGHPPRST